MTFKTWVKKGKEDGTRYAGSLEWVEDTSMICGYNDRGTQLEEKGSATKSQGRTYKKK